MNPFFNKRNIILPEKSIFSKKKFEKMHRFYKNFWIFSKNYFQILNFYDTYKSREITGEFYPSSWKTYQKSLKNSLDREGLLKMAWKFLNFVEKIDWNL